MKSMLLIVFLSLASLSYGIDSEASSMKKECTLKTKIGNVTIKAVDSQAAFEQAATQCYSLMENEHQRKKGSLNENEKLAIIDYCVNLRCQS